MNNYENLKKNSGLRPISLLLVVLVLLEACSVTMLCSRLAGFAPEKQRHYISLTDASDETEVKVGYRDDSGLIHMRRNEPTAALRQLLAAETAAVQPMAVPARQSAEILRTSSPEVEHGFEVYDENTVWSAVTNVEIFKLSYKNGEGIVSVNGDGSSKLIAPGTENMYTFTLHNTCECTLDYTLTVNAYVTGTDYTLPIQARLVNYAGDYLAGAADTWVPVTDLKGVTESNYISPEYIADYTLEWQWPFERGGEEEDAFDTMLGNLAVDDDITLTIVINTIAVCNEDHDDPGGDPSPQTGDNSRIILWIVIMILSLVALIVLLNRRHHEDE